MRRCFAKGRCLDVLCPATGAGQQQAVERTAFPPNPNGDRTRPRSALNRSSGRTVPMSQGALLPKCQFTHALPRCAAMAQIFQSGGCIRASVGHMNPLILHVLPPIFHVRASVGCVRFAAGRHPSPISAKLQISSSNEVSNPKVQAANRRPRNRSRVSLGI